MKELSPYYESVDNGYRQLSYEEVVEGLQQEIERLKEENTILKQTMSNNSLLINENAFLKERIDKAIEYIENNAEKTEQRLDFDEMKTYNVALLEVKDILKGDDKE